MIKTGIKDSYGREINYMRISITDQAVIFAVVTVCQTELNGFR